MIEKSSREETLGCLASILGGGIGFFLGVREHSATVDKALAAHPDDPGDFLPFSPLIGLVMGCLAGAAIGMASSLLLPKKRPKA